MRLDRLGKIDTPDRASVQPGVRSRAEFPFFEASHLSALSRQGAPSRERLERFFSEARQVSPTPGVETGDLAVLRGLLLESDMLTALSPHQLRYELRDGSLVVLDFSLDRTRRDIGLTQRASAFPSPGAKALMNAVHEIATTASDFATR